MQASTSAAPSTPALPIPQPPPPMPFSTYASTSHRDLLFTTQSSYNAPTPAFDPSAMLDSSTFDASTFSFGDTTMQPDFLLSTSNLLLPYGWSVDLPTPALLSRLIDVFFAKSHFGSDMIDEARFRADMALPPTHINYRECALRHRRRVELILSSLQLSRASCTASLR